MMNTLSKTIFSTAFGAALALSALAAQADVENYRIDDSHSFANWTIRHVASKTSGTFPDIKGKIVIDRNDLSKSAVEARINVLSINSSHAKRDDHIKKDDYLDAYKFSEMTFVSSNVEAKSNNEGVLTGTFTMHGISKQLSFPFKVLGYGTDPWGAYRVGLEAHTTLKASDFGFTWPLKPNAPVGDDIDVTLLIEGVRLPAEKMIK